MNATMKKLVICLLIGWLFTTPGMALASQPDSPTDGWHGISLWFDDLIEAAQEWIQSVGQALELEADQQAELDAEALTSETAPDAELLDDEPPPEPENVNGNYDPWG